MGGGTGIGFLDDAISLGTNIATGGLVGYGDGGFKAGVTGQIGVNVAKDLTGATAAEEANEMAKQQFKEEKENRLKDRNDSILAEQNAQIQASNAGPSASKKSNKNTTNKVSTTPIGDNKDFLGL